MDHKHLFVTIVGDTVLLDHVAQSEYIGDGMFAVPHWRVISRHVCHLGHHHGSTVALQTRALACAKRLSHESAVAYQIHCGLAVQKYDLPEIKFDVWFCACFLLEKLRNLWFELLLNLR
jgi:hypothetical protein